MSEPNLVRGRFVLGDVIGAGGSARVHLAHDRALDRVVAVKLLDATAAMTADPAAHERFVREARTTARFSHPHCVEIFDAGDEDQQLFIVMEYLEGGSLSDRIAAEAPMPEAVIVRIGAQVLAGLEAAHGAGIVHRDVKPANILFDAEGTAKLADFGIAKRFDDLSTGLTAAGMAIGTRAYAAPEQAAGSDVGPAADLYSVGALLYEMATGSRPAPGAGRPAPDPRALRPDLAVPIAETVVRALAERIEDRFRSASDMAASLTGVYLGTDHRPAVLGQASTGVTDVLPAGQDAAVTALSPTELVPVANGVGAEDGRPATARPFAGRGLVIVAVVVILAGVAVAAWASARSGDSSPQDPSRAPEAAPLPTTSSATAESTTSTTSTAPPPPTTPTPAPEIVAGFPATGDLDVFIEQLHDGRDTAGKQARKLSDALERVRDSNPGRRAEEIEKLEESLATWVDKGELAPEIAAVARDFLAELGRSP